MSTRPTVPGVDLLFGSKKTSSKTTPVVRHVKVSLYLPADMVADMDAFRAELRADGVTIDRGRLIREAYRLARNAPGLVPAVRRAEQP